MKAPMPNITPEFVSKINEMNLHPRTLRNLRMQYMLANDTLIPWLRELDCLPDHAQVCEIGCAEGGVLAAFVNNGSAYALGTDIQGALLEQISTPVMQRLELPMTFTQHDVIYEDIPEDWSHRFDVVLLRDVIEHLDDVQIALKNIKRLLKPSGVVLITFPPYSSAFGGHQQLLGTTAGSFPFVHLLPKTLFFKIIEGGDPVNQEEVKRLHALRCSAAKVIKGAQLAGLKLKSERYFGLRPVFKWKYQRSIPVLELTWLRHLPFVRSLAMEAAFVFKAD
ncbi:MAG: class I SAM-dependent methyltransferase [Ignavibacteria bacterium]|nr:class I SAM-dependent methyltransferase [Ignavibacteria bacterium]